MSPEYSDLKKFLKRVVIGGLPLGCLVLGVLYYCLLVRPNLAGDLSQLGKIPMDMDYGARMYEPVFPDQMTLRYDRGDTLARVVTIGDSFSQQMPNGFQNFLAHLMGAPVSNISIDGKRMLPEQAASDLLMSGFFDSHPGVEWVIVESVERSLVEVWGKVDVGRQPAFVPILYAGDADAATPAAQESLGRYFSQGLDWLKLSVGLDESPVCRALLAKPCFTTAAGEDVLYFYDRDLLQLSATEAELSVVVERLKALHGLYAARGIKMIFMPAPDKYELYQHLVVDNPYPERELGTQLSAALDTLDFVVNPLPELRRRLDNGEKDIFMADDTHWSSKGASAAASLLYDRLK